MEKVTFSEPINKDIEIVCNEFKRKALNTLISKLFDHMKMYERLDRRDRFYEKLELRLIKKEAHKRSHSI